MSSATAWLRWSSPGGKARFAPLNGKQKRKNSRRSRVRRLSPAQIENRFTVSCFWFPVSGFRVPVYGFRFLISSEYRTHKLETVNQKLETRNPEPQPLTLYRACDAVFLASRFRSSYRPT